MIYSVWMIYRPKDKYWFQTIFTCYQKTQLLHVPMLMTVLESSWVIMSLLSASICFRYQSVVMQHKNNCPNFCKIQHFENKFRLVPLTQQWFRYHHQNVCNHTRVIDNAEVKRSTWEILQRDGPHRRAQFRFESKKGSTAYSIFQ